MAEAIHFQRVTIHLKNGTNLVLDLKPEDHQTVDSQITALQDVLADPEFQEKVFQFRGIRGDSWIRIKEIVALMPSPSFLRRLKKNRHRRLRPNK